MTDHEHEILDNDEVGERPKSESVLLRTADAATILKIADRTVRKRLNNGELEGQKVNGSWLVKMDRARAEAAGMVPEDVDPDTDDPDTLPVVGSQRSGRSAYGTALMPEPVDMEPMADLIADLTRKSIEAATAAAMWQERARQLEEKSNSATLALESGQEDHQRKIEEMQESIAQAREEAAAAARKQADDEWRSKSWWQRLKGE